MLWTVNSSSPQFLRNVPLQYSTGTLVGILASVLILVYIMSRLVPGKVFIVLFGLHHYHHVHNFCCWCTYFNLCIVACGSCCMLRANMWLVLTALSLSLHSPLSSFTSPHPPSQTPPSASLLQKVGAYAFLVVGWSSLAWFGSMFWNTLLDQMLENWQFSLSYFAVTGLLSFAYFYWRGPISNPRSLDVLQWMLQVVGLLLVCWSFQSSILSVLAVILLLLVYKFPPSVKDYLAFKW